MEAFYIAKMKYEHEARLSTPGQQVGKRAGLGYGGLLGKEPTSWICPCCTMPWVKKGARKCMGCGKKTEPIDTATNLATLEMAGTHWQLTVDDQGMRSGRRSGPQVPKALIRTGPATSSSAPRWTSASWPPTRWHARTRTRPASRTSGR